jgi:hypothetical protein
MMRACTIGLVCVVLVAPALSAQQRMYTPLPQDSVIRSPGSLFVRVGKWVTLAGAAGAAAWGITANHDADRRYEDLERLCQADPDRCRPRTASGAFADTGLEQEYQDILDLDDRAKLALTAAEISVATSVVLFILDLPRHTRGEDIPYHPPRLQVGTDERARLLVSYRLGW